MNKEIRKLVFATNNQHKLEEAREITAGKFEILSLTDIGCHDDIPETAPTLEGNALIKARWIHDRYGFDCFADDTGLMVDALDGAPGVHSARYAGPGHDSEANMEKLLENLDGVADRKAHFSTAVALIMDGSEYLFEGRVDGTIAETPAGENGFGYDPVFVADESGKRFAEMSSEEKNAISHRGRAMSKLAEFLSK
ncbi:MAG: non-canonical purine NTP diphosphatase [Muribaculaceae bacterium]|nr:non-canonical purine NTP diphosphatase [Muribaculaceae bacterium]